MKAKRYSFPSKEIAAHHISLIGLNGATYNHLIHGIVELGFQHKYKMNEETQEAVFLIAAQTYDVDVAWVDDQLQEWSQYEVFPNTPSHKFATL